MPGRGPLLAFSLAVNVGLGAILGVLVARRLRTPPPSSGRAHRVARAGHLAELSLRPGYQPDVVVIGDSLVEFGEWHELLGRPVANRGVGGDQVSDVAARLDAALATPARTVVLAVGVNDLAAGRRPEQVAADHARLVATIRARRPDARLVVGALLPVNEGLMAASGDTERVAQAAVRETNRRLAEAAGAAGAVWVDPSPRLVDDRGQLDPRFTYDGVHLVAAGYRAWAEALAPHLPR